MRGRYHEPPEGKTIGQVEVTREDEGRSVDSQSVKRIESHLTIRKGPAISNEE